MKKVLLLLVLMISLCTAGNAKGIELEPRIGASYSDVWRLLKCRICFIFNRGL